MAVALATDRYYPISTHTIYSRLQMPRKYVRKTDKVKWTAEDLKKAKAAITEG